MKKTGWIVIGIVVLLFILLKSNIHFITEWWWFESLNYAAVFWKFFAYKAGLWIFTVIAYFLVLFINFQVAYRSSATGSLSFQLNLPANINIDKYVKIVATAIIALISVGAAGLTSNSWEDLARYFYSSQFAETDPVFHHNLSFYFFTLPFFKLFKQWAQILIFLSIMVSAAVYIINGAIKLARGWQRFFTGVVKTHITILLLLFAAIKGFDFWIAQYDLLYSDTGVVYGAGFTDINSRLFGYRLMSVTSLVLAAAIAYSIWNKGTRVLIGGFVTYAAAYVLSIILIPFFQQKFIVEPNELVKEKPYIVHNIEYTRKAYDLAKVERQNYPIKEKVSIQNIFKNKDTLENIRLWDWRPLLETYKQIQEIRLYYHFHDVDVDRYRVSDGYRQFMISARELAYERVPEQARTWVNQRLKYTHGYGLVASPVNEITPDGLPKMVIKDIPPVSEHPEMKITNPAIYYGEKTEHYIFTGTDTEEFDYPMGDTNKLVRYKGKGGVKVSSFFRRIAYALDLSSIKILISGYFNNDTRIHYYRKIIDRARKIAPFLSYDRDPYLIIVNGRLKWIIDAYTYGHQYPYSEPFPGGERLNYIRNSVKVVIDAYDGDITYYISDTDDPLIQTYNKMFPGLFTDKSNCPEEIRRHFRYPIDLFTRQAVMYLSYHMQQPEVFYNREDMWRFPNEIYKGRENVMQPYYTIMDLENTGPEFLLILPFTPVNKDNMVAWMAAKSDGKNYGKLTIYEFPKKELIFGPMQIEAKIDQEPSISEVLTLWNQQGSSVIRGNLLVIPIAGSILYVEPLFLQADQSQMPELKRVIVAHGNNVVMKENLEEAIQAVFSGSRGGFAKREVTQDINVLVREAINVYQRGKAAIKEERWAEYGKAQEELEVILKEIQKAAKEQD